MHYIHTKEYASEKSRILVHKSSRNKKKHGYPLKSEPQSLALKNIKSAKHFSFLETIRFSLFHLREVSQIFDDSFTRGQPPISVTGHLRILSYK